MGDGERALTDLRFVGPVTADALRDAEITAADVEAKRVDHETLVAAGVNPGVAARVRREHSLAWSHTTGGDLDRRADHVGGLGDGERAWVAASAGDWESADAPAPSTGEDWRTGETTWQDGGAPDPVTVLEAVSDEQAARLANAGVTSVRTLARSDAGRIARSLGFDEATVTAWKEAARAHRE
jgi:hypothetical protein